MKTKIRRDNKYYSELLNRIVGEVKQKKNSSLRCDELKKIVLDVDRKFGCKDMNPNFLQDILEILDSWAKVVNINEPVKYWRGTPYQLVVIKKIFTSEDVKVSVDKFWKRKTEQLHLRLQKARMAKKKKKEQKDNEINKNQVTVLTPRSRKDVSKFFKKKIYRLYSLFSKIYTKYGKNEVGYTILPTTALRDFNILFSLKEIERWEKTLEEGGIYYSLSISSKEGKQLVFKNIYRTLYETRNVIFKYYKDSSIKLPEFVNVKKEKSSPLNTNTQKKASITITDYDKKIFYIVGKTILLSPKSVSILSIINILNNTFGYKEDKKHLIELTKTLSGGSIIPIQGSECLLLNQAKKEILEEKMKKYECLLKYSANVIKKGRLSFPVDDASVEVKEKYVVNDVYYYYVETPKKSTYLRWWLNLYLREDVFIDNQNLINELVDEINQLNSFFKESKKWIILDA